MKKCPECNKQIEDYYSKCYDCFKKVGKKEPEGFPIGEFFMKKVELSLWIILSLIALGVYIGAKFFG